MAEIISSQKGGRRKLPVPRIDLTPMVDLGFLLITFFIYTTTMAKPKSLELNMPDNHAINTPPCYFIKESTITLIPINNHKVMWYNGILSEPGQLNECTLDKVRNVLLNKKEYASLLPASFSKEAHQLHVLIKPNDNCIYSDLVTLLDEMNIVAAPYYALVAITKDEKEMIAISTK